jgi:hypothetical protein
MHPSFLLYLRRFSGSTWHLASVIADAPGSPLAGKLRLEGFESGWMTTLQGRVQRLSVERKKEIRLNGPASSPSNEVAKARKRCASEESQRHPDDQEYNKRDNEELQKNADEIAVANRVFR